MNKRLLKYTAAFTALSLLLAFGGCGKKEEGEQKPDDSSSDASSQGGILDVEPSGGVNDVAFWLGKLGGTNTVMMDEGQVADYNHKLTEDASTKCVDLKEYPLSLGSAELGALLDEAKKPDEERFIGDSKATDAYYTKLLDNVNKAAVKAENPVRFGYAVENLSLRTFPTQDPSYEFASDLEFDLFAETMVKVWEPLAVLHTSKDGKMYFVQSRNYHGWLPVDGVALCKDQAEFLEYLDAGIPLVVTGNRVILNENVYNETASGLELFMGTTLPMVPSGELPQTIDGMSTASGWAVLLPERKSDGSLAVCQALVPWNADVSEGYLSYTQQNVLRQAFKMLGDRHGWSGQNKSRDATSLIQDVFQSFGVYLPRNSAQQSSIPGETAEIGDLSDSEKTQELLKQPAGSLLVMDGHIALYLGESEGVPYVLHSIYVTYDDSGNQQIINAVSVTDLSLRDKEGKSYLSNVKAVKAVR